MMAKDEIKKFDDIERYMISLGWKLNYCYIYNSENHYKWEQRFKNTVEVGGEESTSEIGVEEENVVSMGIFFTSKKLRYNFTRHISVRRHHSCCESLNALIAELPSPGETAMTDAEYLLSSGHPSKAKVSNKK